MDLIDVTYNIPKICKACGGVMVYKGVGEYACEDCQAIDYDDYGKVRLYIETHAGTTAGEIEKATGVSQKTIRQMLKESRLEIAANSNTFLKCELCGKNIRCGRFCAECEMKAHRMVEDELRDAVRKKNIHGVAVGHEGESGQRRFMRERDD